jgi:hypothetical protein
MIAQGFLLIVIGVWLLLQTLAGGLPKRLLSLRHAVAGGSPLTTSPGSSGAVRVGLVNV